MVFTYVQTCQRVVRAVQLSQRGVFCHVQTCQTVTGTIQVRQPRVFAYVQSGQPALRTIQSGNVRSGYRYRAVDGGIRVVVDETEMPIRSFSFSAPAECLLSSYLLSLSSYIPLPSLRSEISGTKVINSRD